ncbi:MAG: pyridoxal phosphate-dependent aminotransferase [Desulfovibrionaceae bacterium]|jgi:aspartate aminotransferase|nr:pyridoxal phosphate-dependent aminotransferase [Desulfovibrionaceae bacterium]
MLSKQITGYLDHSSWIRKMFEAGGVLKAKYGEDNVYDFSLGNPDLPPPPVMAEAMRELADKAHEPFAFGYMPNFGYPDARRALANFVNAEQGVEVAETDVIITCGAAGGLNALFRAVLDPGDEVLGIAPYFVEYGFYTENHGGVFKAVPAKPDTFDIDFEALDAAINHHTRVVLINSPNNPTGKIYPAEQIAKLAELLRKKSSQFVKPIFLLADEPYRFLAYDGVKVPSVLDAYPYAVVGSSFSKNLALAGERVGYLVLSPSMPGKQELMSGLILANRILGYVNAPAIGQKLMMRALVSGTTVDASVYVERRAAMAKVLDDAGIGYFMPQGAFYFFPRVPDKFAGDDVAFCARLQEERILAVPGRGFGMPGYVRLAFCVDRKIIENSAPSFKAAAA